MTNTQAPISGSTTTTAPHGTPVTAAPARTLSIVSLALGAASVLLGFTFLVPIAAIITGFFGYSREPESRVMSVWGIILGGVMVLGWVILALVGVVALPALLAFAF